MDSSNFLFPSDEPSTPDDDFELLALRYLEDMHQECDAKLLDERLKSDPVSRDIFTALAIQVGVLSDPSLRPGSNGPIAKGSAAQQRAAALTHLNALWDVGGLELGGTTSGWSGFRSHAFFIAICAFVIGGATSWFVRPSVSLPERGRPVAQRPLGLSPAVAYLTVDNGAVWSGGPPEIRNVGSAVQTGDEISLNEGIAEFRLSSGVSLSVEGPASLIIQSPSSLVLSYGKLAANVPWTVTDFRASVGPCQFTASDAEFGLWQQGNTLDVHVFSGEVRAASRLMVYDRNDGEVVVSGTVLTDDSGTFARATITKGSALSLVAQDGQLKVADKGRRAKPELFTTKISMAGPLPITARYVDAVMAAKPLGYWRFEKIEDGRVQNEVSGGVALMAKGELRLTGPQGNLAAEFQPGVDSYLVSETLIDTLAESDYTLEVWVKPSHPHHGNLVQIGHEESTLCGFALEVQGLLPGQYLSSQNRGTYRFVHTNNMLTGQEKLGTSCYSKDPYFCRRWQHVVGVKTGEQMRLFVDGKLSATNRERTTQPTNLRVILGSQRLDYGGRRFFIGQLDEVAIYDRALSEQEVAEHHRLGAQATEKPEPSGVRGS